MEIRVNRKSKTIKWIVNQEVRASHFQDMLGDEEKQLFPYVELYDNGDTIEFSME